MPKVLFQFLASPAKGSQVAVLVKNYVSGALKGLPITVYNVDHWSEVSFHVFKQSNGQNPAEITAGRTFNSKES